MPKRHFVGTTTNGIVFLFQHPRETGFYVDIRGLIYNSKLVQPVKVKHAVATLEVLYADETEYSIPLVSQIARGLRDTDQRGQIHIFQYLSFSRAMPFAWEMKSRFKTYDGLSGLVE